MVRPVAFVAVSALLLALVLVACGPQATPAPTATKAPVAAPAPTTPPVAAPAPTTPPAPAATPTTAPAKPVQPVSLRLMTGPMGGSWYPLGGAIAEIIQQAIPGSTVDVQPGAGIINVEGVEAGKTDLGFANACSAADAIAGVEPFKSKAKNVRHLMTMYDQVFQMAAPEDTGIKSVADFKGKQLTTQPTGNTGEQMTRHALAVYGLKYDDMAKVHQVSYSDSVNLVKDRHADVFTLVTTVPAPSVTELSLARKLRIIGIDEAKIPELQKINPGYVRFVIPKGTYEGQTEDVITFGTYTHLIVSADLPDDTVYAVTKALAENVDKMGAVVKVMQGLDVKGMAADVGVPFHPGAEKYYKEVGAR